MDPKFPLSPADLISWSRFGSTGGIGLATAAVDCLAETEGDLMFLADDEIIVLSEMRDGSYLGYCEGVIGRFVSKDVNFTTNLKKPDHASQPTGEPTGTTSTLPVPIQAPSSSDKPTTNDGNAERQNSTTDSVALEVAGGVVATENVVQRHANSAEELKPLGIDGEESEQLRASESGATISASQPRNLSTDRTSETETGRPSPCPSAQSHTAPSLAFSSNASSLFDTEEEPRTPSSPIRHVKTKAQEISPTPPSGDGFARFSFSDTSTSLPLRSVNDIPPDSTAVIQSFADGSPRSSKSSKDSSAMWNAVRDVRPSPRGLENTEELIFDSYRYSNTNRTSGQSELMRSGSSSRSGKQPSAERLGFPRSSVGSGSNFENNDLASLAESEEPTTAGRNLASSLRERMEAGEAMPIPTGARGRKDVTSVGSSVGDLGIPRMSFIFPRSTTEDSLTYCMSTTSSDDQSRRVSTDKLSSTAELQPIDERTATISPERTSHGSADLTTRPATLQQRRRASGSKTIKNDVVLQSTAPLQWRSNTSVDLAQPQHIPRHSVSASSSNSVDATVTLPASSSLGSLRKADHPSHQPFASTSSGLEESLPLPVTPLFSSTHSSRESQGSRSLASSAYTSSPPSASPRTGSFRHAVRRPSEADQLTPPTSNRGPPSETRLSGWLTPPLDAPKSVWSPKSPVGFAAFFKLGGKKKKSTNKSVSSIPEQPSSMGSIYEHSQRRSLQQEQEESPIVPDSRRPSIYSNGRSLDYGARELDTTHETDDESPLHGSNGHAHANPHPISKAKFYQSTTSLGEFKPIADEDVSPELLRLRESRWIQTMEALPAASVKRSKKVKNLIQNGIPDSMRGRVWAYLAEVGMERVEGAFQHLCTMNRIAVYDQIEEDMRSTYPDEHALNSDERADLLSVLEAFAQYRPELGWCKGLGNIVAMLLQHGTPEDAFWLVVALVKKYDFARYFSWNQGKGQAIDAVAFRDLLDSSDSKLGKRLVEKNVVPEEFLDNWLSTLFTRSLPYATSLRLFDSFLFDPKTALRTSFAILSISRKRLLDEKLSPDRMAILDHLSRLPEEDYTTTKLLPIVFSTKLRTEKLAKAMKKATKRVEERR